MSISSYWLLFSSEHYKRPQTQLIPYSSFKVYPPININAALRQCASSGRLVVGVTWVVEFLSLVDPVALHSQHYLTVVMTLIAIFRLLYIGR